MLAWLDANANSATQTRLRTVCPTLYVFSDLNAFIDHITTNVTESNSVILIVSGFFGQQFLPLADAFPQLHAIYVYCIDAKKHMYWAIHCDKIGVDRVFSVENDLIARLILDIKSTTAQVCNSSFECLL